RRRGRGHPRGGLRAVPRPERILAAHTTRTRRDRAGVSPLRVQSTEHERQRPTADAVRTQASRSPNVRRILVKEFLAASVVAILALLFGAALAAAHETWILPASMRIAVNKTIAFDLTSGMAFPADDFAIDPKRVAKASARIGGTVETLTRRSARPRSLRFVWTPRRAGVATIGIELAPRTLLLEPKLIDEYYEEIHASPAIRAQWDSIPSPKQWRESYVKNATTFVRVGAPVSDTSWSVPLGLALEIVPRRNPTALTAGETLPVLVLRQGAPVAGFQLGARREGAP